MDESTDPENAAAMERRQAFAAALKAEREHQNWSQAAIGMGVGVTGSLVGQWEQGRVAPPEPDVVFKLEVALGLPPGRLSRHLGYLPVGAPELDVVAAIESDPRLDYRARALLTAAYRVEVRASGASS